MLKEVIERAFAAVDVAGRMGIPRYTLYEWMQGASKAAADPVAEKIDSAEIRRLEFERRRETEERDVLGNAAAYFAKG
jgi:transposase